MDIYQALADPVRRTIVEQLARNGECSAGHIAETATSAFGITQPTTSKHLRALREAGVVTSRVDAQRRVYRLEAERLAELAEWANRQARFWNSRLDSLERHLHDHPQEEQP